MKKRLLALTLATTLVFGVLSGCTKPAAPSTTPGANTPSPSASTAPSETAGALKFGVTMKTLTNPYYLELADAMKGALKDGDELIVTDAQQNQAKQISDVEDLIQQGCKVIFINPVDWKGTRSMLEACKKAGVYSVIIDQNVPDEDAELATLIMHSDNYEAGRLCAESLVKAIDGKGEVVIYESSISRGGIDRVLGFEDYLKDYPEVEIVNRQDGVGQIEAALPVMENMLQANPDIVGVFAFNDPSAIGCLAAIESANKLDKIKVYGVDGSQQGKEMIANGKMAGSAAQFPSIQGKTATESAYKLIANESLEKEIVIPVEFIDAANVDQYMK